MFSLDSLRLSQTTNSLPPFKCTYKCLPISISHQPQLESGDKIILPASAFGHLARTKVLYPMTFSITNKRTGKIVHGGISEFTAKEGSAYIPDWIMEDLSLNPEDNVEIASASLPKGDFVKLQAHKSKAMNLQSNPIKLALLNFTCLTKGQTICIFENKERYYLNVLEFFPSNRQAVFVLEHELVIEFEMPLDYTDSKSESDHTQLMEMKIPSADNKRKFVPDRVLIDISDDSRDNKTKQKSEEFKSREQKSQRSNSSSPKKIKV